MLKALKSGATSYYPVFMFAVSSLIMLSLFRLGYFILFDERILAATDLPNYFLLGIRADIIQVGYFTLIPLLLFPLLNSSRFHHTWVRFSLLWFAFCFSVMLFMEVSTPAFLLQYDSRPNRLFFEYLLYPKEVIGTLWQGFRGWLLIGGITLTITIYSLTIVTKRLSHRLRARTPHHGVAWLLWPFIVVITLFGIRSTLAHVPLIRHCLLSPVMPW